MYLEAKIIDLHNTINERAKGYVNKVAKSFNLNINYTNKRFNKILTRLNNSRPGSNINNTSNTAPYKKKKKARRSSRFNKIAPPLPKDPDNPYRIKGYHKNTLGLTLTILHN